MREDGRCMQLFSDVAEFCKYLQPPPLPFGGNREPFLQFINSNPDYKENFDFYSCLCNITLEDATVSPTTVVEHTTSHVFSTTMMETVAAGASSSAVTIIVVFVILLLLGCLAVLLTWLYKRHKRTGRGVLPPLPLATYQTTNYLDNKAREKQCWKDTPNEITLEKPFNGNPENEFIPMSNTEAQTSVRKLKRISKGSTVGLDSEHNNEGFESACHDNKNFVNDDDAHSPGTDSNIPLFADMVDGVPPPLPNVPDNVNGNAVQNLPSNSEVQIRSNRLPPLQHTNSQSSVTSKGNKSPKKKKKNRMFNRNSEPVRGVEEENDTNNTQTL